MSKSSVLTLIPVEILLEEHPGEGGDAENVPHAPDAPHHHLKESMSLLKVRFIFFKTASLVLKGLPHEKDLAFDDMYG